MKGRVGALLVHAAIAVAACGSVSAQQPLAPPAPPAPPPINLDPLPPGTADALPAVQPTTFKKHDSPRYPLQEDCDNIGGIVILLVTVDKNGDPVDVRVERTSHNRNLDRAAIDAAKKWQFNPTMKDGQASGGVVRVPVDFRPEGYGPWCPRRDPELLGINERPDASRIAGFEKFAAKGSTKAMRSLGSVYEDGNGVTRDPVKAKQYFEQAAALGDADAQVILAVINQAGLGTAKDSAAARGWLEKAAAQGNTSAQLALGNVYMTGDGVPVDANEAARWYKLAAQQGNAYGEIGLAMVYFRGQGAPQDDVLAYAWGSMAAAQVYVNPSQIDLAALKGKLTPAQLQQALDLASHWKKGDLLAHPTK